jgi:hypothetical protein
VINYDNETYQRFMIEKVVTAIKLRWPNQGLNRTVVIKHDGASCHIEGNNVQFNQAAKQGVRNICLEKQHAKSPDTNVLDLLFLRALQAKQWSLGSETTIDGLIAQLLQAFEEREPRMIDFGFLTTLQACSSDMMEMTRGNDYIIQHLKCFRLLRNSSLVGRLIVGFLRY